MVCSLQRALTKVISDDSDTPLMLVHSIHSSNKYFLECLLGAQHYPTGWSDLAVKQQGKITCLHRVCILMRNIDNLLGEIFPMLDNNNHKCNLSSCMVSVISCVQLSSWIHILIHKLVTCFSTKNCKLVTDRLQTFFQILYYF